MKQPVPPLQNTVYWEALLEINYWIISKSVVWNMKRFGCCNAQHLSWYLNVFLIQFPFVKLGGKDFTLPSWTVFSDSLFKVFLLHIAVVLSVIILYYYFTEIENVSLLLFHMLSWNISFLSLLEGPGDICISVRRADAEVYNLCNLHKMLLREF